MPSAAITERAPAKINLALHVLGRRSDGYHEIESLVAFTDLADILHAAPAKQLSLSVDGPFAQEAGTGDGNLVLKAARLLQHHTETQQGAALTLTKHIPVGGGLGGGSADAAATLRALNRLWELDLSAEVLMELAAPLGADVPMCMANVPTIARGIGEKLSPLRVPFPRCHVLLVHPRVPLLTIDVYKSLALSAPRLEPAILEVMPANYRDLITFLSITGNDLTEAAKRVNPFVGKVLQALGDLSPRADCVRMTGSGACCFALYETRESAVAAADALRANHPEWWQNVTSVC